MTVMSWQVKPPFLPLSFIPVFTCFPVTLFSQHEFIRSLVSHLDFTSRSTSSPHRHVSPLPHPPHSPTLHRQHAKRAPVPRLESPRRILNLSRTSGKDQCW